MPQKPAAEEWSAKANFVFIGAVVQLNATTVKHLSPTDRTAIVKVEQATRALEILEQYVGTEITVQLSKNEKVAVGERTVFYTQSLMVGESLVVQSLGHVPVTARTAAHEADPALREQVANADIVVTGKVTAVRTIDSTPARASRGRPKPGIAISEHDPVWCEAVIQVTDIESGDEGPKEIVVRFPASTDVLWHEAPKFEPGQQGVFLLTRAQSGKRAVGKQTPYTALSPASFQPMQKVETIRSIIRSQKH